jgi:hypothetical protein
MGGERPGPHVYCAENGVSPAHLRDLDEPSVSPIALSSGAAPAALIRYLRPQVRSRPASGKNLHSRVLLYSQYADRAKGMRYAIFARNPVSVTDHGRFGTMVGLLVKER